MSAEPPAIRRVLRRIRLLPYQMQVMRSRAPYLMVPAGLGSGKSFIAAEKALRLAFDNAGPEVLHLAGLCVEPTYKQVTRIMVPALRAALYRWGIEENGRGPSGYRYFKNDQMIVIRFAPDRVFTIYLASAERPDTLVGPNLCFVIFDEAGYVDPLAWANAMPRVRHPQARLLQFMGVGTPEGFGAFYEFAEGAPKTGTELVRACTLDNRHLQPSPAAYVSSQLGHFSEREREAYVRGRFVARGGSVYDFFDEDRHLKRFAGRFPMDAELVMGCDFGYHRTAFVFGVVIREPYSARGEMVERLWVLGDFLPGNTGLLRALPMMREKWLEIADRYFEDRVSWPQLASQITAYTDSTKWQDTDRRLLEQEGMYVHEHSRNPHVMSRVYSLNKRLADDLVYVDPENAPQVAHSLRNQGYAPDGFPEKPHDDGTGAPGVDHACIARGSLVSTARGAVPIEDVRIGDLVQTRAGHREVVLAGQTGADAETVVVEAGDRRVVATPDHRFFTVERGWVPAARLTPADTLLAWPKASSSTGSSSAATQTPSAAATASTTRPEGRTGSAASGDSTRRSGSTPTAISLPGTSSTTSTRTRSTTISGTSPASRTTSTPGSTPTTAPSQPTSSPRTKPEPGTEARRGAPGTASTVGAPTRSDDPLPTSARTVVAATRPPRDAQISSTAREPARRPRAASQGSTMSGPPAGSAAKPSSSTSTPANAAVQVRVRRVSAGPAVDVFNLTVADAHEFLVDGVLVHNCDAAGYIAFGRWPIEAPRGNLIARSYH